MPHTFVPVHIRPHLISFLFREFKPEEATVYGKRETVAKVSTLSPLGKILRLCMEKTYKKPLCDKTGHIFLKVGAKVTFSRDLKYTDGRSSFLVLPEPGQQFLNDHLETLFETASMFFIHSWHQKKGDESLDTGILTFFDKYDLEEFDFNVLRIRRDYYRKLKAGYFQSAVCVNPTTHHVTTAG